MSASCVTMTDRDARPGIELHQQFHHFAAARGIEVSRRFVGEQHCGRGDDGPGDGHALLLSSRQVRRAYGAPIRRGPPTASASRANRWRAAALSPRYSSGNSTFSCADVRASRLKPWNTKPMYLRRSSRPLIAGRGVRHECREIRTRRPSAYRGSPGYSSPSTCPIRSGPSPPRTRPAAMSRSTPSQRMQRGLAVAIERVNAGVGSAPPPDGISAPLAVGRAGFAASDHVAQRQTPPRIADR